MALIMPPFPAPSRPSKTMHTLSPLWTTHCCTLTSSPCSFSSSSSKTLRGRSSDRSLAGSASDFFLRFIVRPRALRALGDIAHGCAPGRRHSLRDGDRLPEQGEAVDEERESHAGHHRELPPHRLQPAA